MTEDVAAAGCRSTQDAAVPLHMLACVTSPPPTEPNCCPPSSALTTDEVNPVPAG